MGAHNATHVPAALALGSDSFERVIAHLPSLNLEQLEGALQQINRHRIEWCQNLAELSTIEAAVLRIITVRAASMKVN